LSQVFGVGYMNQKRITPDRAHGSAFSTHSYQAIAFTTTFSLYVVLPPFMFSSVSPLIIYPFWLFGMFCNRTLRVTMRKQQKV